MLYTKEITVSANTAEVDAEETIIKLSYGVITWVSFRPRPGHHALVHVQVYYQGTQLFPTSLGEDLHGDMFPIEWDESQEIFIKPYEVKIKSWSDDLSYSHTFDISLAVLPRSALIPYSITKALTQAIRALLPGRR